MVSPALLHVHYAIRSSSGYAKVGYSFDFASRGLLTPCTEYMLSRETIDGSPLT